MLAAVQRPTLLRPWIRQMENGLVDRSIGGGLGCRVRGKIARNPDLGASRRGHLGDDERNQHECPQHDQQREATGPCSSFRHRLTTGSGSVSRGAAFAAILAVPDRH
jgi:hypothetical protein